MMVVMKALRSLILEGPKGSGKSTLAQRLRTDYQLAYHHEGPPPMDVPLHIHYGALLQHGRAVPTVFDRLALGEYVYGPLLRGVDRLTGPGWVLVRRIIKASGALQILCLPPVDVCIDNVRRRDQMVDEAILRQSWSRWSDLQDQFDLVYDYTTTSDEDFIAALEGRAFYTHHIKNPLVIGSPYARVLFVGDRGGETDALNLPFFDTIGASLYLQRAIAMSSYDEHDLAFVNAYTNTHEPIEIPTHHDRVVAFGASASDACRRLGLRPAEVPHPQYWRTYHYEELEAYVRKLEDAR